MKTILCAFYTNLLRKRMVIPAIKKTSYNHSDDWSSYCYYCVITEHYIDISMLRLIIFHHNDHHRCASDRCHNDHDRTYHWHPNVNNQNRPSGWSTVNILLSPQWSKYWTSDCPIVIHCHQHFIVITKNAIKGIVSRD